MSQESQTELAAAQAALATKPALEEHQRAAIQRAKLEWERAADALDVLVCLLDSKGMVLRANRVVEFWGLGSVSGVVGRSAHAVLHPSCGDRHCEVAQGLAEADNHLESTLPYQFEYYSPSTDQTFRVTVQPLRRAVEAKCPSRDSRAVLVVADVSALRRTQSALTEANLNLESRVRARTHELDAANRDLQSEVRSRQQAQQELHASRNDLALLSEQLIQAQELERRRIALELHDSVGQSLSAIKYTLERAIVMLQRGNLGSPESVLAAAVQRIHETSDGLRRISRNLRPPILDSLGAASAASWLCREFGETYPALNVDAQINAQDDEIPSRIATHLFRCMQELLGNVAKHAQARTVWVRLERDGTTLSLMVRDDGVGLPDWIEDSSRVSGFGMRNLRERAQMTGGVFTVTALAEGGTAARVIWELTNDGGGLN